ncbi:MAG: hypothetical protein U0Q07_14280 [Acidimicrobiales bacterium]
MAGDQVRQVDLARRAMRKRRVGIALAVVATVVVGLIILGLNTNRVVAGTTYDDVAAVPQVMDCLEGSGVSYYTIDAGGIRWYEARSLPASDSARYGQFQQMDGSFVRGRLRVLTDIGGNTFSRPALKSGRDLAEFDVGDARYLFTAGGLGMGC